MRLRISSLIIAVVTCSLAAQGLNYTNTFDEAAWTAIRDPSATRQSFNAVDYLPGNDGTVPSFHGLEIGAGGTNAATGWQWMNGSASASNTGDHKAYLNEGVVGGGSLYDSHTGYTATMNGTSYFSFHRNTGIMLNLTDQGLVSNEVVSFSFDWVHGFDARNQYVHYALVDGQPDISVAYGVLDDIALGASYGNVFAPDEVATNGTVTVTGILASEATNDIYLVFMNQGNVRQPAIDNIIVTSIPPDTTPPAAPTGLAAIASDATIDLSWTTNSEPDLASYNVLRSDNAVSNFLEIASGLTDNSYTDQPLPGSATFYYVVQARDISGNNSANSAVASATTPADAIAPAVPTNLVATISPAQVNLNWDDNTELDFASYTVFRSETSGIDHDVVASNLTASAYADTNVVNDITYYYFVTATDLTGNESAGSDEVSATPTDNVPAAPTALYAVAGNAEVALYWVENDEPENDLVSYGVYRSTSSGAPYDLITNVTARSYVDTGLVNGTPYYYVITAVDAIQESPDSNELTATPEDKTFIIAPNLLNDPSFTNNPDPSIPVNSGGANEVYRYSSGGERIEFETGSGTSTSNDTSNFTAPIDILSHADVTSHPDYHVSTAKLTAIVPNFTNTVSSHIYYTGTAGLVNSNQVINGWYEITVTNGATVYTATSETANLFAGLGSRPPMRDHVYEKWNQISWDVDPFASGGLAYADIDGIGIKFFHETVVPNTADDSGTMLFYDAPIIYYASVEPAEPTVDPTITMSTSGGSVELSWTDGFSYDVWTNGSLTTPNWGFLINSASPVVIPVGGETELFYELRYYP